MKAINIGMLGFGTVGTGVARLLLEKKDLLARKTGATIRLLRVADIDLTTDRGVTLEDGVLVPDAFSVVEDPEIDIIVELIGGEGVAKQLMEKALSAGKQVVTANKALLARHGNGLFRMADEKGVDLAYEASVCGCMPIIKTLRESLAANDITALSGILNGTCNYILSKITREQTPFAAALAEAQANGYAEADPTLDVDGFDTAHKLAILMSLAFNMRINYDDIYIEGIRAVTPFDIAMAGRFGYRIKLLAITKMADGAVEARVHPTMIPCRNLLSNIESTLNAVTVTGDAVGDILLYGHGAGMMPTASAVVGDIVDLARNVLVGASGKAPQMSVPVSHVRDIPVMPMADIRTHYYFRFAALDRPGVLSRISGVLGDHGISIKSAYQEGHKTKDPVDVIMLTHQAREADVQQAIDEITALDIVADRPMIIRIEDENGNEWSNGPACSL